MSLFEFLKIFDKHLIYIKMRIKVGILGTGNQIKVFSTVLNAINKFVNNKKPKIIRFSAAEKSRKKLYERLIKVIGSKLGYIMSKKYTKQNEITIIRKEFFDEIENAKLKF